MQSTVITEKYKYKKYKLNKLLEIAVNLGIRNFRPPDLSSPFHRVELSSPGTKVPWNFRSLELLFPGTFVPGDEVPWNFRPLPHYTEFSI